MKKIFLFALVATVFAACSTDATQDVAPEVTVIPDELYVSFADETSRIQLGENGTPVWTKGDFVSVYYRSDANQKWQFKGETGDTNGTLVRIEEGKATQTTTRIVAVYPYNEAYWYNWNTGNVEAYLPDEQTYLKNSYGLGSSIMVSSSEYKQLSFKNVFGWLKLQITGTNEKVRVITFRGNNGEQVAGEVYINTNDATMALAADVYATDDNNVGGNLFLENTIINKLYLECNGGAALSEEPTDFYIALPPQIFTKGFTIEVYTTDGKKMIQSTDKELTIERNHIQPMAAFKFADNNYDALYIPDLALKAYLVNNYDDDYDGEISIGEAEYITMVNCSGKGVEDLTGLEACSNLVTLNCSNNNISTIELPNLLQLKTVTCNDNPISRLNFDNCTALQYLNLQDVTTNAISGTAISIDGYTQAPTLYVTAENTLFTKFTFKNASALTTLELYGEFTDVVVTNNKALTSFVFYAPVVNATISGNSVLEGIDVSTLLDLETLDVQKCKLQSLDVTKNLALASLVCNNNELTALDVSKNTALVKFYCNNNKLPRINVRTNTLLEEFDISNNLLSTLNVRNNTALTYLCISDNAEMTMVDVEYNTALKTLYADGLAITDINLTANTELEKLSIIFNDNLTSVVGASSLTKLKGVGCQKKTATSKGMLISLTETSLAWGEYGVTTNARDNDNGANNMATLTWLSSWPTKYPAFNWCDDYGAGWYLPALNELKTIYNNKSAINKMLSTLGYPTLGTGNYWSSTEYSNYDAYRLNFSSGSSYHDDKDYTSNVRAVLAF